MPEAPAAPVTALQADIAAKTAAAVQDTGFGKDFDLEVDAAIANDAATKAAKDGKAPVEPVKPAPKAPAAPELDIPEALLGEKKPKVDPAESDKQRQKELEEGVKGLSPKAADRFRALEAKKHEAEQRAMRATELEKKLADAEARLKTQADNSETERLKKQIEELDEIVTKNALADHPRFKSRFDTQIEREITTAASLVSKEASEEVKALLSLPDTAQRNRRLNEIIQELEPLQAGKFNASVVQADRLVAERSSELANWKANKQRMVEISQAEQSQTAEQRQKIAERAYKGIEARFTDDEKGIELFRRVEGNDEWNRKVDERLSNVKKALAADLRPDDVAEMAAWAMAGSEYRKLFLSQRLLVKKLQEEIQSIRGVEPGLGGSGDQSTDDDEAGSLVDVLSRQAQRAGAVR